MTTKPKEFTLIRAKQGGWCVFVDLTEGIPDFVGTLPQCTCFIEQLAEPTEKMEPDK